MDKEIKVVSLPNAFSFYKTKSHFPEKTRLSEIVKSSLKNDKLLENANVWISDKELKCEPLYIKAKDWENVIVKGDTLVTIRACPTGGGGGKDPLKLVLTVALIAAAAWAAPSLAAYATGTAVGKASATAVYFATGSIMLVGTMAINALIPPPKPTLDLGGSSDRSSPTLSITGSQNKMNPYGVVPRVFGKYKVFPTMAAQPYTEIAGNDQYLRLLFDFGYGELTLTDLKIGDTDIANFDDVETEIKYGTPSDTAFKLYSNDISESPQQIKVTASGGAKTVTTTTDANEAIIDGMFEGLVSIADDGTNNTQSVQIKYEYSVAGAGSWTTDATVTFSNNIRQRYYVSHRIQFSTKGQYDVRVTRVTADSASELILDEFSITSVKTVKDSPPIDSSLIGERCMVAMRIKATDQLNGVVDQFNAIAQAKLPSWNGSSWAAATATRNPAWAFAEVLRGSANGNPVADSMIDGDGLKTWADACDALAQDGVAKWQFDAVVDYPTTVFELLRDIAAAGRASFGMVDGKYTVVRDVEQSTPVQHFTPRNSWGFSSTKVFTDAVHGIKCRFINPDRDYQQDEVIAYDDGYTENNATKFHELQFWGCTNKNQAWREGRYHIAVSRLRPEIYSFSADVENIICTRGDMIRVLHDVTSWGQKGARIKAVTLNGSSEATSIDIDEEVTMTSGNTYNVRLRADDGSTSVESVTNPVDTVTTLTFTTPIAAGSVPKVGDLIQFGETNLESVELVVKKIEPHKDLSATFTCVDAAPDIHDSDTGTIPAFDPKITTTPKPFQAIPDIPVLLKVYSDEDALLVNTDGSTTPQIIADIEPQPIGTSVQREAIEVRYKLEDSAKYNYFTAFGNPSQIIISPVLKNRIYDLGFRAVSQYGQVSAWKNKLGYQVEGRIAAPATPSNFTINIIDTAAHLYWDANTESDLSYYQLRFSTKTSGASYENAIDLLPELPKSSVSAVAPARTGTYFLKAFDTTSKGSTTAAEVTTIFESVKNLNVVTTQTENPGFTGTKTDCLVNTEGFLILDNTVLWDSLTGNMDDWTGLIDAGGGSTGSVDTQGTYDFANYFDLGSKYTSRVTATIDQTAIDYSNTFDALLGNIDILSGNWDDLNDTTAPDVNVKLQVAVTDDDPSGSPTWTSWQDFFVGDYTARALKFRAVLTSNNVYQTPQVSVLTVTVDMPDRVEAAQDIATGAGTYSVTFTPNFKALSGISISAQDLVQGDYYKITNKAVTGFDITFYDSGDNPVSRTFDYTVKGYGHLAS